MTIDAGTSLNHYEILSRIGAGGMGEVYRARDAKLNREVAEAIAMVEELDEKYARKESNGMYVAALCAGLGDKDKAFEWLERIFEPAVRPWLPGLTSLPSSHCEAIRACWTFVAEWDCRSRRKGNRTIKTESAGMSLNQDAKGMKN